MKPLPTVEGDGGLRWYRVPGMPDAIRAESWDYLIRRVYDDGATLYQLWDVRSIKQQEAPTAVRGAFVLLSWHADSESARQAAVEHGRGNGP